MAPRQRRRWRVVSPRLRGALLRNASAKTVLARVSSTCAHTAQLGIAPSTQSQLAQKPTALGMGINERSCCAYLGMALTHMYRCM